jgi:enamine deaminase RidA (YjgF/YER057c/UK114 family)
MKPSEKLRTLGIELPALAGAFGAYVLAKRIGNLIYVAGQLPTRDGKLLAAGPVPSKCSPDQAKSAARQCVINALAAARTVVDGDVDQIAGVLRVGVFVSSDAAFTQQPQVANGASELLLEIFGDAGPHVRAAVGVNILPLDASVEIEFIFIAAEPA